MNKQTKKFSKSLGEISTFKHLPNFVSIEAITGNFCRYKVEICFKGFRCRFEKFIWENQVDFIHHFIEKSLFIVIKKRKEGFLKSIFYLFCLKSSHSFLVLSFREFFHPLIKSSFLVEYKTFKKLISSFS